VDTPLRKAGVALARRHGLRMQTHLDEQRAEKQLVEEVLYPDAGSYTDVYARDGLLDCEPILAHCIQMRSEEFDMVAASGSSIAHCPVSNTLLGSGVMPLDAVRAAGIPHSLCTDVGASPTTSLFCEMAEFLKVHAGSSAAATRADQPWRRVLHVDGGAHTERGLDAVLAAALRPDAGMFTAAAAVGRPVCLPFATIEVHGADGATGGLTGPGGLDGEGGESDCGVAEGEGEADGSGAEGDGLSFGR
jgi:cytosine/adenosine deaminase-related metal-dependent hydrolase